MPITLYFRTLFLCIYNRHLVKKVRIHHSCSLNPPKTSFLQARLKKTSVLRTRETFFPPIFLQARLKKTSVLRTRETFFPPIFTSGMMIRPLRLEKSNPQKCLISGLFQPSPFVINVTHSTWDSWAILHIIMKPLKIP